MKDKLIGTVLSVVMAAFVIAGAWAMWHNYDQAHDEQKTIAIQESCDNIREMRRTAGNDPELAIKFQLALEHCP